MNPPTFIVTEQYRPLLERAGLDSFAAVMTSPAGAIMRSVPGRSTVRLQLDTHTAYLKRYTPLYYSWWQRIIPAESEAIHEWHMIHTLRHHGFNTATPVVCGRHGRSSFLLTLEIPDGVAADKYLPSLPPDQRHLFLARIADLVHRFHAAGFIHRDFYLSHIFVCGQQLYLIDLQRVRGPGRFHPRWQAKDLGQLVYTLQLAGATHTELAQWLANPHVRTRVAALHARGPKHDVIWNQPGVDPR